MISNGTRLGPYEILAPLGAEGEVYRARDTRLDRTVAVKVPSPAFASNPQLRQRFEREARPVQLFKANIKNFPPPFYDVTPDGQRFLVNLMPEAAHEEPVTLVRNWDKG